MSRQNSSVPRSSFTSRYKRKNLNYLNKTKVVDCLFRNFEVNRETPKLMQPKTIKHRRIASNFVSFIKHSWIM